MTTQGLVSWAATETMERGLKKETRPHLWLMCRTGLRPQTAGVGLDNEPLEELAGLSME